MFDLIAFRASPVRIHRISVDIPDKETGYFRITPHAMGRYLLEDGTSLAAIAAIPSPPSTENHLWVSSTQP